MGQSIRNYDDININLRFWFDRVLGRLESPVFYDIGANDGVFSRAYAERCRAVYAFEPSRAAAERLEAMIAAENHRNVTIFRLALGDEDGAAELHGYSDDTFNSLYRRTDFELAHYSLAEARTESVKVARLDAVVERFGLEPPGLVKIDVEGAELFVLRGGERTIRAAMPVIVAEYSVDNTTNAGYERVEIGSLLERWGYSVYGLFRNTDTTPYAGDDREHRSVWNLLCLPPALDDVIHSTEE